jgi:hypothetical protein
LGVKFAPGVNLIPRVEFFIVEGMLTPRGENSLLFRNGGANRGFPHLVNNFTPRITWVPGMNFVS